ncbi:MAG TPA: hypothetical protein VMH28_21730 [Candidatus Acidoferrales bacterium]|nr:hypothetical protein [Candidatus Acidoferrales bacterium]
MLCLRLLALSLVLACIPLPAQSVVSTHSGLVYFFEGSVYLADQPLEQRFGRFPDIGEGGVLRTERGRAEVLLTPGVFLRVAENSAIRMISTAYSDTRVELAAGSAIMESSEPAADPPVTLCHKSWQVRLSGQGVYRIDSEPPRVSVYKGKAEVTAEGDRAPVAILAGQNLPLAGVLVPEESTMAKADGFKSWAMSRSEVVSSDNATAAGIIDDPNLIDSSAGPLGGLAGGLSYFPLTGIPGVAVTNPYGLSFWSPYQSTLSSIYFPSYSYGLLYPSAWPITMRQNLWRPSGTPGIVSPIGGGLHLGGIAPLRVPYSSPPRMTHPVAPPHVGVRPVGHR